jgi:hypothetical protein
MSTFIQIAGSSAPNNSCITDTSLIGAAGLETSEIPNGEYPLFCGSERFGWTIGAWNVAVNTAFPGFVTSVKNINLNCGITLSADLFPGDIIKFSGTSNINYSNTPSNQTQLSVGLVFATCDNIRNNRENIPLSTIIATQNFDYTYPNGNQNGYLCFLIEHTVTQTFLAGETVFYAVFGCNNESETNVRPCVSFSLGTVRNCGEVDLTPNMELQLCCDSSIVDIVYDTTLTVGDYFVDNEGNCWEAQAKTGAQVTSVRTVTTKYTSCEECISFNECPDNIIVESCCFMGAETFTASLPGVSVGDIFVDTYGFCWTAVDETSGPITGMVIVDTNYGPTVCEDCLVINTCPEIIELLPCCKYIGETPILTTTALFGYEPGDGELVVDTFGNCYTVNLGDTGSISAPFIQFGTSYGVSMEKCMPCIDDNACGQPLYYNVINCCTGDTEVIVIDTLIAPETVITITTTTSLLFPQCWKVVSFSNTGTATIVLDTFIDFASDCNECVKRNGCITYYEVEDCCGIVPNGVMLLLDNSDLTLIYRDDAGTCWSIVGPTVGPATVVWNGNNRESCSECACG